jgi:hypothetical protein
MYYLYLPDMHNWIKLLCIICHFTYMISCCVSSFAVDTKGKLSHMSFCHGIEQDVAIPESDTVNPLLMNMCSSV